MTTGRATGTNPTYDGAPRPITVAEAHAIAHEEYAIRRGEGWRWLRLSRGADGGMHWRGSRIRRADAEEWVRERRRDYFERILAGEAVHLVFYDRARHGYYAG
jgi:hypothetical protein